MSTKIPKINVVIRKRPLSQKELSNNDMDIVQAVEKKILVRELKQKVDLTKYIEEHCFYFDDSFDEECDNEYVYSKTVKPLVDHAFNGAKVTCFAYGQTGSGKTYTMIGNYKDPENPVEGLYVLAAHDIFSYLQQPDFQHLKILVSFYEIYCGKLFDLLNNRNLLHAREDGRQKVNIVGLQQFKVDNVDKLMEMINYGSKNRVTSMTGMNHDSSRSHAILQINIVGGKKTFGKVSFIDLAGNERGADTYDQDKQTRMDGAEINKSLLALKECIRALDQVKKHTPFRGSKLTMVLKDSFIGNCKTVMIGNISPSFSCCEHTLNTLRYADRVKELKKGTQKTKKRKINPQDDLAAQLMLPRQHSKAAYVMLDRTQKFEMSGKVLRDSVQNKVKKFVKRSSTPKKRPARNNYLNNNSDLDAAGQMERSKQMLSNHQPRPSHDFNNIEMMNPSNNKLTPLIESDPIAQHKAPRPIQKRANEGPSFSIMGDVLNLDTLTTEALNNLHERLISVILSEEEDLITNHKTHVEKMCDFSRTEFELLRKVEQPGSDIDHYVDSLTEMLDNKRKKIMSLKNKLNKFKQHLLEEQQLSSYCSEKQEDFVEDPMAGNMSGDEMDLIPGSGKENIHSHN